MTDTEKAQPDFHLQAMKEAIERMKPELMRPVRPLTGPRKRKTRAQVLRSSTALWSLAIS